MLGDLKSHKDQDDDVVSFPNFLFEVSGNNLDCSCSLPFPDMSDLSSSSATPGIVSCQSCIREALKNGIF